MQYSDSLLMCWAAVKCELCLDNRKDTTHITLSMQTLVYENEMSCIKNVTYFYCEAFISISINFFVNHKRIWKTD